MKILLVEDEILIAFARTIMLQHRGYEVLTARSGAEALEMMAVAHRDVNLILMDVSLGPDMDGVETTALILQQWDVPVIFLTGIEKQQVEEMAKDLRYYGHVSKSAPEEELDEIIEKALMVLGRA